MKKIVLGLLLSALCLSCTTTKKETATTSATLAAFNTNIPHFWAAYDAIQQTQDSLLQRKYLDSLFLKPSSNSLHTLRALRNYQPEDYLHSMTTQTAYWNSVRKNTLATEAQYETIQKDIAKLKSLYPALKPSSIHFDIGLFRTNGTIRNDSIFIAANMALADKTVNVSELSEADREYFEEYTPIEDLPFLCVHEYVHTQQQALANSLLVYTLYEGIAEYVSYLATGKEPYVTSYKYVKEHGDSLKKEYLNDVFYPSKRFHWIWSAHKIHGHKDMAYAIGFFIAKAYYEKATDKNRALKNLIELDFSDTSAVFNLVDASGYFDTPMATLKEHFDAKRPSIARITGITNKATDVPPGRTKVTLHFSEPLNGQTTGVDFGPRGRSAFPKMSRERTWDDKGLSWSFTLDLKPKKQYQILISENFRTTDERPLQPLLIEFTTK